MLEICLTASLMAKALDRGVKALVSLPVSLVSSSWVWLLCLLGLSNTSVIGDQLRVGPDQRNGFSCFAFSYTTARLAKMAVSSQ